MGVRVEALAQYADDGRNGLRSDSAVGRDERFEELVGRQARFMFQVAFGLSAYGQNQTAPAANAQANQTSGAASSTTATAGAQPKGRSPGGDVGSGAGDIGKGAAKGAGNLAEGTGKGAVDLVTLHPIDAAGAVGKGGASAGKNVVVGTAKGTGKIVKGTGRAIKKIF